MNIAHKISEYNRERKWGLFQKEIEIDEDICVLDAGFSDKEYSGSDNFIEKHYPYPDKLTALGVDIPVLFQKRYPQVRVVQYKGGVFPFRDKEFDVCWSNAVIEHVGSYNEQLQFLKEVLRVSKAAFITTPNKYFPFELHTRIPILHWLPKPMFDKILNVVGKKWAAGDYMYLLSIADMKKLLEKADISQYKIIRNKLLGFTMDFVVVLQGA